MPISVTREDLYNRVWSEPMDHLARQFNVSGVALAKACRKLGIPTPGRGYWQRLRAGRAGTKRRPLPPLKPGQPDRYCVQDHPSTPRVSVGPVPTVVVAQGDAPLDPLLVRDQSKLEKHGLKVQRFRASHRCPAVNVSPQVLPRALRILDAAFKACRARGLEPEITSPVRIDPSDSWRETPAEPSRTGFRLRDTFVEIELIERFEVEVRTLPAPTRGRPASGPPPEVREERPLGQLVLRIIDRHSLGLRKHWGDGKTPLEKKLGQAVLGIEAFALRLEAEAQELAKRQAQWAAEAKAREEEARRVKDNERLDWDLSRRLEDVRRALEIRQFVALLQNCADAPPNGVREKWMRWALARATSLEKGALVSAGVNLRLRAGDWVSSREEVQIPETP